MVRKIKNSPNFMQINIRDEAKDGKLRTVWDIIYLWPRVIYDFSALIARKHFLAERVAAGKFVFSGR